MIDNYILLKNGVIKQKNINKITIYNNDYVSNSYDKYGEKTNYMSFLRLGYLIGTIGRIPKSILDVGYGNGSFLKSCSDIIPNCYGNDISNYELPKNIQFIDDITSKHFDVISFFDSLEHFEDINFVKNLNCNYIIISVPWCHNVSDEWFFKWKHRRPDEHIYHFNEISLNNFMTDNGYELINFTNVEDTIRKSEQNLNILTCVFKKNVEEQI